MHSKNINLIIEGSGRELDFHVDPDTSVWSALERNGFDPEKTWLQGAGGGRIFGLTEDLFNLVSDGDKLSVSPSMKVATGSIRGESS